MRKVFLEDLPKDKYGDDYRINWRKSLNYNVKFIFDDIEGEFKIVDYKTKGQYLYIQYLDHTACKIKAYAFIKCKNMTGILSVGKNIYVYDELSPKRVDLRGLDVSYKGIDWSKSEGKVIPFIYDNLSGEVQILKFNNENRKLTISYLESTLSISTSAFMSGKLGGLLNKYRHKDDYDISKSRRIDLRKLPMYGSNIDWVNSPTIKLDFVYDDIVGTLEILSFSERKVMVKYLDNQYLISTENVKNANLSCIFGRDNAVSYLYAVGDIVAMENGNVEVMALGKYDSGGQNYMIKCLNCGNVRNIDKKGILNKNKCVKCSRNIFKISDDGKYWIGTTQNGEDFWFDGNDKVIQYVKSYTWRKTSYGYFQNRLGDKLHRIIMNTTDPEIYINHKGGKRHDNRQGNLTISNCLDNSKEKKLSSRNTSGIIGLMKRGKNNKWVGCIKVKDISLFSSYKERDEALIDLLIMQREYGFRHNIDLYYLLDSITQERIDEVINLTKRQLSKKRNDKIVSSNIYELSDCGTYYNVYDSNKKSFKISLESKKIVENGLWHVAYDKASNSTYIHGTLIIKGIRKTIKLHRYLFDLLDVKYRHVFVDHLNGDSLDNRMSNLQLTDANGNGKNKPGLGYMMRWGKARASITINGKCISKTFDTKEEASAWYENQKRESIKNRLTFESKLEVDEYLKNKKVS